MSFLIAVHVNEGIVLASDRRSTYSNTMKRDGKLIERIGIHTTNSTDKTFLCPNGSGISASGEASLMGAPITGYIREMIRTHIRENTDVSEIPNLLLHYFRGFPVVPDATFIVAGYQTVQEKKVQKIFKVNMREGTVVTVDTNSQGATWDGEGNTLARLLLNVAVIDPNGGYNPLPSDPILFEYFTLQDAVDFARYAVETTIQTMRFKNVIETVGGEVDLLVITPEETKWLQKAELK